jgi:hypothetical protein
MIGKLKALGLAVLPLVVLTAAAPAAQATIKFEASAYTATATGSSEKGTGFFSTEAGKVECAEHFEGSLTEASSTFTVAPTYTSCSAFGFLEATVAMNGCTYVLHATEKVSSGVYRSHADVSAGKNSRSKSRPAPAKSK